MEGTSMLRATTKISTSPPSPPPQPSSRFGPLAYLAVVVSLGGLLFGLDTGVVSGALAYLRDDKLMQPHARDASSLAFAQEAIVSSALATAAVGSGVGGILADALGRRSTLLFADALFVSGSLIMACAPSLAFLVCGRAVVGFAIGAASVVVPVYIAEASPPAVRASLCTVNVLLITFGQFLAYVSNYACSFLPGTWRWMLGVPAVPALLQLVLLLPLPESPRWLAGKGRMTAARAAAAALQMNNGDLGGEKVPLLTSQDNNSAGNGTVPVLASTLQRIDVNSSDGALQRRINASDDALLRSSACQERTADAESSLADAGHQQHRNRRHHASTPSAPWRQLFSPVVLRELHVGVGLQVLQQLAAINTVMYYAPTMLLMLAGVASRRRSLLVSLIPAGVNTLGSVVGMLTIDRVGRRKLLLGSLGGVVVALIGLGYAFRLTELESPGVVGFVSLEAPRAALLQDLGVAQCTGKGTSNPLPKNCAACLRSGCGFCSALGPGAALEATGTCLSLSGDVSNAVVDKACANSTWYDAPHEQQPILTSSSTANTAKKMKLYTAGCPNRRAGLVLVLLVAYLACFSPGVGPVPWAVNSEIYPLEVRGMATGIAASSNWVANAIVAQTFLTMLHALGASFTFWVYGGIAAFGWVWAFVLLPETKGLSLDQVQAMFHRRAGSVVREASGVDLAERGSAARGGELALTQMTWRTVDKAPA